MLQIEFLIWEVEDGGSRAEDMAHIKADLCPCSPEQKVMPLDALCQSGTETPQWRWDVLVGEGDPLYCKSREI